MAPASAQLFLKVTLVFFSVACHSPDSPVHRWLSQLTMNSGNPTINETCALRGFNIRDWNMNDGDPLTKSNKQLSLSRFAAWSVVMNWWQSEQIVWKHEGLVLNVLTVLSNTQAHFPGIMPWEIWVKSKLKPAPLHKYKQTFLYWFVIGKPAELHWEFWNLL